jgi:Carboxypeptidase regulatory-like domain
VGGHWERERRGERWEGGHWDKDGDRHAWHPGGWHRGEEGRAYPPPPPPSGGRVSITGQVLSNGRPVPGVTVVLAGTSEGRAITGPDGSYAFMGLVPGSYAVRPNDGRCSFAPDVMNLNNLGGPTVQNFNANCRRGGGGW